MLRTITRTFKKLLSDKRGDDFTNVSSGLSKAGSAVIACACLTGVAAGAAALTTTQTDVSAKASEGVAKPVGVTAKTAGPTESPFKQ